MKVKLCEFCSVEHNPHPGPTKIVKPIECECWGCEEEIERGRKGHGIPGDHSIKGSAPEPGQVIVCQFGDLVWLSRVNDKSLVFPIVEKWKTDNKHRKDPNSIGGNLYGVQFPNRAGGKWPE